jgi:hypothetical protein
VQCRANLVDGRGADDAALCPAAKGVVAATEAAALATGATLAGCGTP